MNGPLEDEKRKKLRWGVLLAWSPFALLVLPTVFNAFRGISEQKATGVGAVAGIFCDNFVNFGVIVTLVFEVTAIVLLLRTFSKGHVVRGFFSVLSIGCSGVMLFSLGLFLWWLVVYLPHHR